MGGPGTHRRSRLRATLGIGNLAVSSGRPTPRLLACAGAVALLLAAPWTARQVVRADSFLAGKLPTCGDLIGFAAHHDGGNTALSTAPVRAFLGEIPGRAPSTASAPQSPRPGTSCWICPTTSDNLTEARWNTYFRNSPTNPVPQPVEEQPLATASGNRTARI